MIKHSLDIKNALKDYPLLKAVEDSNSRLYLEGVIEILHPQNHAVIDFFSVKIFYPPNYPYCFPKVIETSGKIERTPSRHIYMNDNTLCLAVKPEEILKCRGGITTTWFLDYVLTPRLAEEYLVNNGGKYLHEFDHGNLGNLQYYMKKFNVNNSSDVIDFLKIIAFGQFPKESDICVCGSGKKYRKCHRIIFEEISHLGTSLLLTEIGNLKSIN